MGWLMPHELSSNYDSQFPAPALLLSCPCPLFLHFGMALSQSFILDITTGQIASYKSYRVLSGYDRWCPMLTFGRDEFTWNFGALGWIHIYFFVVALPIENIASQRKKDFEKHK